MATRKPKPKLDPIQTAGALVNAATDSGPVRGEDLLPPRLAKQLREAKKRAKR